MQKMYTCMAKCISSCTENGLARILLLKWSDLKTGGKIKGVPPLIGPKGLVARVLKMILVK